MKLGTILTIHLNILSFLGGTGFVLVLRGNIIIGSIILLSSGIYGNILARVISKKLKVQLTKLLAVLLSTPTLKKEDKTEIKSKIFRQ